MFFCFLPMTRLHQALIKISLRVTYQSRHQICSCCVLLLLYIIKAARYRVLEVRAAAAIVCEVPGSLIEQIIQIKQQLALVWALSGPHTRHLMDLGSVAGPGRGRDCQPHYRHLLSTSPWLLSAHPTPSPHLLRRSAQTSLCSSKLLLLHLHHLLVLPSLGLCNWKWQQQEL